MSRFGNKGRFSTRYEMDSIYESMREDLQQYIGQLIPWYRFDRDNSVIDPIYDVGGTGGGRAFHAPFLLPVISAGLEEGVEINTGQGEYTSDICHLVVSYDQAEKAGLRKMATNWRLFLGDRFVFNDTVFQVRSIQVRGPVGNRYEVLGIDGWQVNAEELVNDPAFFKYAGPGDPATVGLEVAPPEPVAESAAVASSEQVPADNLAVSPPAVDDIYGGPS